MPCGAYVPKAFICVATDCTLNITKTTENAAQICTVLSTVNFRDPSKKLQFPYFDGMDTAFQNFHVDPGT